MDDTYKRKYDRVLDILRDVSECAGDPLSSAHFLASEKGADFRRSGNTAEERAPFPLGRKEGGLALAGGTALALFYLKHRVSVDLDFIPIAGNEAALKEALKGCLSKKGYRTQRGAYTNQFMVQFEDTTIKVEIFKPSFKIGKTSLFSVGSSSLRVVSLEDLLKMKTHAYCARKEARDLFDIMVGKGEVAARELLAKYGEPKNPSDVGKMANSEQDAERFRRLISNAAAAGN